MCCDDTKSCSHYCPFGSGCEKCDKLDKCVVPTANLSPTDTPGSDEVSVAETTPDSPEPTKWIDYLKIPRDLEKTLENDTGLDLMWEIYRAQGKIEKRYPEFMGWLHTYYYDVPKGFVWGAPEGDQLADLNDFFIFLVQKGLGKYEEIDVEVDMPGNHPVVDEPVVDEHGVPEPLGEPVMHLEFHVLYQSYVKTCRHII